MESCKRDNEPQNSVKEEFIDPLNDLLLSQEGHGFKCDI
jgi:hypothetical protein